MTEGDPPGSMTEGGAERASPPHMTIPIIPSHVPNKGLLSFIKIQFL